MPLYPPRVSDTSKRELLCLFEARSWRILHLSVIQKRICVLRGDPYQVFDIQNYVYLHYLVIVTWCKFILEEHFTIMAKDHLSIRQLLQRLDHLV